MKFILLVRNNNNNVNNYFTIKIINNKFIYDYYKTWIFESLFMIIIILSYYSKEVNLYTNFVNFE